MQAELLISQRAAMLRMMEKGLASENSVELPSFVVQMAAKAS